MASQQRTACAMLLSLLPTIALGFCGAAGIPSLRHRNAVSNFVAHAQPSSKPLRCIVVGGSSGVGEAICLELGKRGAKVFVTGRKEENLQKVAAAVEGAGGYGRYGAGDVTVEADVKRLYAEAEGFFAEGITVDSFGADSWVGSCFSLWTSW